MWLCLHSRVKSDIPDFFTDFDKEISLTCRV